MAEKSELEIDTRAFWTFAKALREARREGTAIEIWEANDEVEVFRKYTNQPAIVARLDALIDEKLVGVRGGVATLSSGDTCG